MDQLLGEISSTFSSLLGLGEDSPGVGQMALRAVIVFVAALVMVRLGEKRFLGKSTAFDVILGIVIGSVLSRAINGGSAPFFATLVAGVVLVGLHWLLAVIAFRFSRFGTLIKGSPRTLVEEGRLRRDEMRKSHITEDDLQTALRTQGHRSVGEVNLARLERSGEISVIGTSRPPRVVEVRVEAGVQTVRIELSGG